MTRVGTVAPALGGGDGAAPIKTQDRQSRSKGTTQMSNRTIASRGRLRGAVMALSVAGAMALAPAALAQTVTTVSTSAQLVTAIANANTAGGTNEIILTPDTNGLYEPTAPITIQPGDNLEITSEPKNQATTTLTTNTQMNLGNVVPEQANAFTVSDGASLLLKGFSVTAGAFSGFSVIEDNGNVELDNMVFFGNLGTVVSEDQTGIDVPQLTIDNSFLGNNQEDSVENNTGNATLNNVTVTGNTTGGVGSSGTTVLNNTLVANDGANQNGDCFGSGFTANSTIDNDGTCGGTTDTLASLKIPSSLSYNGGPTFSPKLGAGSAAYGAGNPAYCLSDDQRFFATSATTCDVGSYQENATSQATNNTVPICTVFQINESNNPSIASTETVNVTDPGGPGIGPDADIAGTFTRGTGTVAFPTDSTALGFFPATDPTAIDPSLTDEPSTGPFPVTASKPVGDVTPGDTSWQFTVQDWLGNSTTCK